MKKSRYASGGEAVPVGFLDTANADVLEADAETSTEYAADKVVRIAPTSADTWISIRAAADIAANHAVADTVGSHFIPFGGAQDLAVNSGDKIHTTAPICVTPFK